MKTGKPLTHNKALTSNSQRLRKEMTKEERQLWFLFLRHVPFTVNRQKAIGRYIVDFYCHRARLVVELDGSQHYEPIEAAYDRERDAYLEACGLTVLRYSNRDIHERFEDVCNHILMTMKQNTGQTIVLKG